MPLPPTHRRHFLAALPALVPGLARAAEPLRILAWPGYADPDIVKTFAQRSGSRVEVTTVDTDAVMWQKISQNQAQDFDLFAVNTAELQRYIRAALVVGIPVRSMPNLARQLPRFQKLAGIPGLVHGGTAYAIPYTYAEMGLIYDRQQLRSAPDSIAVLWDERYRGRVIAYNGGSHNFSLAAQALGLASPFRLAAADWPRAVDRLIALRRNVAGFYTEPEEAVALFKQRRAAVLFANYGTQQLKLMRAAGVDAGYAIPREGALAWLDCWAITRGARNPELASAWINYLLEPEPGQVLVARQGLANTTSEPPDYRPGARLVWLEPVENDERRNLLWSRIVSGDRASKVLAP